MNREEFIGKLQACYFGDRNAFNEIVSVYDELNTRIDKATELLKKYGIVDETGNFNAYLDTIELKELLEILKGDKE